MSASAPDSPATLLARLPWWVWAAVAAVTLPFANGPLVFWLAPWPAFLCLVRFFRIAPRWVAVLGGTLLLAGATAVHVRGALPLKGAAYVVAASLLGLTLLPPFLLDRLAARRLPVLAGTLVLPAAWVVLESASAALGPYGTWGAVAYSQRESIVLLQLVSITGLHGLSFLVLWFATSAAAAIGAESRRALLPWALLCGGAVAYGVLRLAGATPPGDGLAVALVTPRLQTYLGASTGPNAPLGSTLVSTGRRQAVAGAARDAFRERSRSLEAELLERTERAVRDGARLVLWSEGALMVAADDEAAFLERAGALARASRAYLSVSYLSLHLDGSGRIENLSVLLDTEGRAAWRYVKAHPVPGLERCVVGKGPVPLASTALGTLSAAICFDVDFPRFLHPAAGADLLLVPSDDWAGIARVHSRMAAFRAVELGTPLARSTSAGISSAVDAYGRELSSLDFFAGPERTLLAKVPARGVRTVYGRVGELFPALCAGLVLALAVAALRPRSRRALSGPASA